MKTYPIPMVPGPVSVPPEVLAAQAENYGSSDLEPEFLDLYNRTEADLQTILGTENRVVIQSGEGMLALWSALKSCILPGDRVLAIGTGVFGYGIGDMARSIGAEVSTIGLPYDRTLSDLGEVERAIVEFRPKMITAVHCETPSGTLNPLDGLGELKRRQGVPLLYVDAVASVGGAPVLSDEWSIDLALGGTQKAISAPPGVCFLSVSPAAWEIVEQVNYSGIDALKPFRMAQETFYFPYTPYWHGIASLHAATQRLLAEGLDQCYARHARAAEECRAGVEAQGLALFPAPDAVPAPTVTAVRVPEEVAWPDLDARFRAEGLAVGGSYGLLSGKVFRLGHMGTQADLELVRQALEVMRRVLSR